MWGDEFLYQQLGYKHIYSKLKDVTEADKFIRKVQHSLMDFRYDGKKYRWSDLAYTPVKVFLFSDYRIEVMPAYAEFKNGEALSTGEKNEQ